MSLSSPRWRFSSSYIDTSSLPAFSSWPRRSAFHDRWEGLLIVFRALSQGQPGLGLPALGGLFEKDATASLDQAKLSNRACIPRTAHLARSVLGNGMASSFLLVG
jgi:hypothetical protein